MTCEGGLAEDVVTGSAARVRRNRDATSVRRSARHRGPILILRKLMTRDALFELQHGASAVDEALSRVRRIAR